MPNLYNLYYENDSALEVKTTNECFPFYERDFALGNNGIDEFKNPSITIINIQLKMK